MNQKIAGSLLQRLGHDVELAEDGAQGLECWRRGGFDLILMDILMPVMDGLEAMREIRREESGTGRHVPIVVVTADVVRHSKSDMLAAGFDGYLSKPVSLDMLRAVLGRIDDKRMA